MGIGSKHEVEELVGESVETRVEIRSYDVVVSISSEEGELGCGVGDDGRDSDKRGAESIGLGR